MPTALVTGGCGFIASNFINRMKDKYPDIDFVTVDKMDYCSNTKNIHEGKAIIVKGNVGNAELIEHLIHEYKFDYVFHFAAQSHVDNSFNDPKSFTLNNAYGTHVLLDKFRELKPNVEFIHFSTDEVYGTLGETGLFKETTPYDPNSPYSASTHSTFPSCWFTCCSNQSDWLSSPYHREYTRHYVQLFVEVCPGQP